MLKFLATTENTRKSYEKIRVIIAGKLLEKQESKIAIRSFTIIFQHEYSYLVSDRKSRGTEDGQRRRSIGPE